MSLIGSLPEKHGGAIQPSGRRSPRLGAPARRACVAVLTGLAAFAVFQLAASTIQHLWFPEAMDPGYGARLQRLKAGRAADPAHTLTVLMIGTSRTDVGFDSPVLEQSLGKELRRPVCVVNFGVDGAGHLDELLAWRQLRRDGVRPDLLLVEVLPAYLNDGIPWMEANRIPPNRINWFDVPVLKRYLLPGTRPRLRGEVALADITGFYSRRLGILHALAPDLLPCAGPGETPLVAEPGPRHLPSDASSEVRSKDRENARNFFEKCLPQIRIGSQGCQALRELLASCREAGVPAALVAMPEGPALRSWYAPGSWPRVQEWLEQVCREEGAALIDAHEWMEENDFVDSNHLDSKAAEKFTERLGREHVLPLLRRQTDAPP